jgi:hypothetical protein
MHWHRYAAFVGVALFHFALVGTLLRLSQTTRHAVDEEIASSLILLPSVPARPVRSPLGPLGDAHLQRLVPRAFEPESITYPSGITPPADWNTQATEVAADLARRISPAHSGSATPAGSRSIFPAPEHHTAEQYRSVDGESIVWVSDRCYIDSPPSDPALPGAFAHATLTRTVCPEDSKAARGDLFEALPAYRKNHGAERN